MSTTIKSITNQQRLVKATRELQELLAVHDTKLLSTALAEAAVEEARRNENFAKRVQFIYQELEQQKTTRSRPARATQKEPLIPIRSADSYSFDPHAALDPYFLQFIYGDAQLRRALDGYSLARLKEAAAIVEEKHPGTKPTSRAKKDAIIDYIVEHVAGPGY